MTLTARHFITTVIKLLYKFFALKSSNTEIRCSHPWENIMFPKQFIVLRTVSLFHSFVISILCQAQCDGSKCGIIPWASFYFSITSASSNEKLSNQLPPSINVLAGMFLLAFITFKNYNLHSPTHTQCNSIAKPHI